MNITVFPSVTSGKVRAIASKSAAHRLLICAAFADTETSIRCEQTNEDITATAECLCALGAKIKRNGIFYDVTPIKEINKNAVLPCNESGSTLRFLVPICAALNGNFTFEMKGRLPSRPLSPLKELLEESGILLTHPTEDTLSVSGKLIGDNFSIAGNVSSQFITGLLFALSILKREATLNITTKIESEPYINITLDALSKFGINVIIGDGCFTVPKNCDFLAPTELSVEGDWSNAAFPLSLGIIGKAPITVENILADSKQGDKKIIDILRAFGGKIEEDGSTFTAYPSELCGINIDASNIPDLVPILATVASVAKGTTVISGASRLRLKESDRLTSISTVLSTLGADIRTTDDGLIINGKKVLNGGAVDSFNDHRIAMSAAIASSVCTENVIIFGAEAVNKSYPDFWRDMKTLRLTYTEN
ncbi:MAG: 3-phosphoshikimate 1-carboxyvinyltransferase [Ruminococcaceae bacterium]|nr:3-phosphoshikimate 1-carboxyvinyltransferase [Oscillospiraceae bacterium]